MLPYYHFSHEKPQAVDPARQQWLKTFNEQIRPFRLADIEAARELIKKPDQIDLWLRPGESSDLMSWLVGVHHVVPFGSGEFPDHLKPDTLEDMQERRRLIAADLCENLYPLLVPCPASSQKCLATNLMWQPISPDATEAVAEVVMQTIRASQVQGMPNWQFPVYRMFSGIGDPEPSPIGDSSRAKKVEGIRTISAIVHRRLMAAKAGSPEQEIDREIVPKLDPADWQHWAKMAEGFDHNKLPRPTPEFVQAVRRLGETMEARFSPEPHPLRTTFDALMGRDDSRTVLHQAVLNSLENANGYLKAMGCLIKARYGNSNTPG